MGRREEISKLFSKQDASKTRTIRVCRQNVGRGLPTIEHKLPLMFGY